MAGLTAGHLYAAELAADGRLLSKLEAEVARLLCQRLSAAEIATRLLISPYTVQRHIANIYEKLRVGKPAGADSGAAGGQRVGVMLTRRWS